MKNILVTTDYSPASYNAAKYAVALAHPFDATVYLLHVVTPPVVKDDAILAFVMVTQAELIEESNQLMKKEIKELLKNNPITIEPLIVEGYASKKIIEIAGELQADLIVMGMKGKGKSQSFFGSTTTDIIRKSAHTVLVIPENATFHPLSQIILACDFNAGLQLNHFTSLLALSEKFNALIKILNVQKKESSMQRSEVIGKMKTSNTFSKHPHRFHTIYENNVEKGIQKFIEMNSGDMLAMVAHKHSLIGRVFGKVYTKAMSYQTKLPLLVMQGNQ